MRATNLEKINNRKSMWRKLEKNNDKGIDSKERAIGIKKMTKMKGLGTKNISQSRHLVEEKYEKNEKK